MSDAVSHKGRILSVDDRMVHVEIVSESACSACHAAGLCGMSESKIKVVDVPLRPGETFTVGQEVEVCLARKTGMKAVLLSYVIPVLILLILILSLSKIGLGELISGLLSLLGVAIYYVILFLFRDRMAGEYEFYIRS